MDERTTIPAPYANEGCEESSAARQIMQRMFNDCPLFNDCPPFEAIRILKECQGILLSELEKSLNESKELTAQKAKILEEAQVAFGLKR